ncbi:MAG: hypothetical protein JWN78_1380 [Bacteroidota bacterium]|nr:hypothetical protein [Bacteroidota bacterium]
MEVDKAKCPNCGKSNPVNYKYCAGCGFELPKSDDRIKEQPVAVELPVKTKKKFPVIIVIIAGAIGFVTMFAIQYFLSHPTYNKVLMQVASELNKSCPIMVDQETRLDNVVALPDKTFQYNYTLINMERQNVDINALEGYLKPVILNSIKTNPDMKPFRDQNTTIAYSYKDRKGVFLFKLLFTPMEYK